jgi:hypothetical protein
VGARIANIAPETGVSPPSREPPEYAIHHENLEPFMELGAHNGSCAKARFANTAGQGSR